MPVELTYEQYVGLVLNRRRAQCRQAQTAVIAARIAAGKTAPLDYYALDTADEAEAQRLQDEAHMAAKVEAWTRSNR